MEMELRFLDWLQGFHTPVGDFLMLVFTGLGNAGIVWIALSVILLLIPRTRRSGLILAVGLCVDLILCNAILKNLVARIRPFDVNTAVQLLVAKPKDFSFPSGHTAASFTAVTGLFLAKEKKIAVPALVLSLLIAFSRLYLYVHYPTDILGGIAVGIIAGLAGFLLVRLLLRKREQ